MTDDDRRSNQKFELSGTQVAGSALAAMSGAFLASYLGTAGTIIGAVVGSLVATVGTAAYTWWLRRTSEVVKRTATQVRETGMGSTVVIPLLPGKGKTAGATADADAAESPAADSATEAETSSEAGTDAETDSDRWAWARNRPWGKVALAAAGVALAVVAGLTVVESITGKPLSSYTKGGDQTGSTVGNLGRDKPKPSPSPTPAPTPSKTSSPTPTPSPSQSPVTPTPLPTETPTGLPTDTPTPTPSPSDGITATP